MKRKPEKIPVLDRRRKSAAVKAANLLEENGFFVVSVTEQWLLEKDLGKLVQNGFLILGGCPETSQHNNPNRPGSDKEEFSNG
jgi:hypothetical protein